jgi:hypothetical protein
MNGFLPVISDGEFACDAMLFEGLADEAGIGRIVFDQENGRDSACRRSASLLRGA